MSNFGLQTSKFVIEICISITYSLSSKHIFGGTFCIPFTECSGVQGSSNFGFPSYSLGLLFSRVALIQSAALSPTFQI